MKVTEVTKTTRAGRCKCVRAAQRNCDFETCTTLYQDVRVSVGRRENRETDDKQPRTWWEMMSSETTAQRFLVWSNHGQNLCVMSAFEVLMARRLVHGQLALL
jgi:hypothetical protein